MYYVQVLGAGHPQTQLAICLLEGSQSISETPRSIPRATMNKNLVLCVSVLALAFQQVYSQDACERITTNDLGNSEMLSLDGLLSDILTPGGEQAVGTEVRVRNVTIVCEAQHMMQDRYRYTSVVVSFNCLTTDARVPECNDSSVVNTEQFDLGCLNGEWTPNVLTVSTAARTTNPTATLSTGLDTYCIVCINPINPEEAFLPAAVDTVTHCSGCPNCPDGLQRCYYQQGTITEVCCNYFHNSSCVEQCPDGYAPNDQFECEMQCPELVAAIGVFSYTNQRLVGSVAILTCREGYEPTSSATCVTGPDGPSWSGIPMCDVIKCADVEPMVNGDVSYEHESRVVNTVVTYVCGPGYYLDGNRMRTCTADRTWVPSPGPSCVPCAVAIRDCVQCEVDKDKSDEPICTFCREGFILDSDGKCTTFLDNPPAPTTAPRAPTLAPQAGSCDVPCIIGIVLAILAVIIIGTVVAVVAFVLYKYLNDPATKLAKTDTGGLNGVTKDNPLYMDPAAVTKDGLDEVVTETVPLDA